MAQESVSKILAIRTDRFGEFILTLPAMHALKEKFPNSKLTLMAGPLCAGIVRGSSDIDDIIEYADTQFCGVLSTLKLIGEIKRRRFDLVVIFNPKKKFNIITFLAGIPIRVGYDRKWGFLLNRKIADLKFLANKHEVEYNLDLAELIGAKKTEKKFMIAYDKDDLAFVENILSIYGITDSSSLIAVHPWASDATKQWRLTSFITLSKRLAKEHKQQVLLIGGKEQESEAEDFAKKAGNIILNLVGRLSLRQLIALSRKIKFLISNDSGPIHLAAAVGTPVIALFRCDIPGKSSRRWGPYGTRHIVIEKTRLDDISVEEVLEKAITLIKRLSK